MPWSAEEHAALADFLESHWWAATAQESPVMLDAILDLDDFVHVARSFGVRIEDEEVDRMKMAGAEPATGA